MGLGVVELGEIVVFGTDILISGENRGLFVPPNVKMGKISLTLSVKMGYT